MTENTQECIDVLEDIMAAKEYRYFDENVISDDFSLLIEIRERRHSAGRNTIVV